MRPRRFPPRAKVLVFLAAAAGLCVLMTEGKDLPSLWPNLAASFAGTLVTVSIVDRMLQRHQKQQWSGLRNALRSQLDSFVNRYTEGLAEVLGEDYGLKLYQKEAIEAAPLVLDAKLMFAAEELSRRARDVFGGLTSSNWTHLCDLCVEMDTHAGHIAATHHAFLEPPILEALVNAQTACRNVRQRYEELKVVVDPSFRATVEQSDLARELRVAAFDAFGRDLLDVLKASQALNLAVVSGR